jgi:hypothetical protein
MSAPQQFREMATDSGSSEPCTYLFRDADIAFIKHTRVREEMDLEFRAEIFNLTNTPAFGQPNGVLGSSAFGTITSTATDPRVIQFGLKLNY